MTDQDSGRGLWLEWSILIIALLLMGGLGGLTFYGYGDLFVFPVLIILCVLMAILAHSLLIRPYRPEAEDNDQ